MEPQYNIIFRGKIVSGKDPENARKVLNAIFKQQAPKVLGSMNGGAPYIRKNLTLDQARKFKAVFDKAGAQIQVVKTFKCPDCGHIQKTNSQCEKCMNLKMEFESGPEPDPIDETPAKAAASPKRPKGKGPAPTFSTKKLNQYATYKVVFKGKIQPGFDQETVKNHLANEFKAEVFKVNAPFAGGDDYHQGRLNGIKAEELRERFELAGALVEVIETVKCPMCGKVLDAGENCPDCFEEREPQAIEDAGALDIAPEIAKPQRDNAAFGEGVDDKEELRLEGMVRFRRGVILFSVLFLLHSFIGRERAFAISWIYLLPVPYFLGACYNLAKHKGYSTKFGLLGILSLLGATVMLLLPNKSQGGEHGRFLKKDIVVGSVLAAFLLIFPISAGTGAHKIKSYSGEFEVYREKLIHSDAQEPMDVMVAELESFIDHSFSIQSSMKPRTLEALENAEKMITILEFFFIRLQRLQALQMQTEAGVSPDFTDASLAGLQHRIMTDFKKKTSNERTGVTSHAFQVWLHLTQTSVKMVKDKKIKPFIKCLNESFEVLNDQLAIYMGENFLTPPIHVDQIFNAPNYADFPADYKSVSKEKLEEYVTINVSENGFITFTIKANEEFPSWTAGKTVVFIPTATKKIDFRGRVKYLFKIKRVGGNLQDAFLEKRNVLYEATRQFQLRL